MEDNTFYQESATRVALEAGQDAMNGRKNRDQARMKAFVLDAWERLMSNANPAKATLIACFMAFLNLCTSWEMNLDLLDQSGMFHVFGYDTPPLWSPLIIALPLEAFAFYVAMLLGKSYNRDIFEWRVWNRQHIVHNGKYLRSLAEADERNQLKQSRSLFWLTLTLLMIVQGGICLHRIHVMESSAVAILLAVLAFVFLLGEVIAGVYFDFLLKKWPLRREYRKLHARFLEFLGRCGANDRMVSQLIEKGREAGETFELNGDMNNSLHRHRNRSLDDESYLDEVVFKRITVEVSSFDNRPVANIRVIGLFANGLTTDAGYTNERGSTILCWNNKEDALASIQLNDFEIAGPFSKDLVHRLRLQLPAAGRVAQLEN